MARRTRKNTNPLAGDKVTYFHSGSNHAGEIEGWASIGAPIGVAVDQLKADAIKALKATAGSVPVFVDSGAFSEVEFPKDSAPVVAKPISAAEWTRRLAVYQDLAETLGSALTVVAPDMVAFPAETLTRLATYREQVRKLAATGARVLVCLQGADKAAFWQQAQDVLGLTEADGIVPALPCKKNATSPAEVVDFVKAARPASVHCLGLGARNQNAAGLVQALRAVDADLDITLDSNALRANVGRDHEDGGKATASLTEALDAITREWVAAGRVDTEFVSYTNSKGQRRHKWTGRLSAKLARERKAESIRRAFCYGDTKPAQLELGL